MVQQVWKDKGMPEGLINKEVTGEFAKRLWAGVTEGYGDKAKQFNENKIDWDTPDAKMLAALQNNVWHFSAAKNYTQLRELSNALIGDDGKLRTEKDFLQAALKINEKQVKQHLKAEYQLAVVGSQASRMWVEFDDDAMLEFDAVIDGRTTDLCRSLNGTTLPKLNPFWNVYMIPNHFGERSTVRQVYGKRATEEHNIPSADIPPMFKTNLGKQGLIFPKGHAYFIDLPKEVLSFADAGYTKDNLRTGKGNLYESGKAFKDNTNPSQYKTALRNLAEYQSRKDAANLLANYFDKDVFITPEGLDFNDWRYSFFFKNAPVLGRCPDFKIGEYYWEMKGHDKPYSKNTISNIIKRTSDLDKRQCDRIIIKLNEAVPKQSILNKINGELKSNAKASEWLKEIIVIDKDNNIYKCK